ncbi:hypothetical protein ACFL3C_04680 [Patescibacteria group bacterium]
MNAEPAHGESSESQDSLINKLIDRTFEVLGQADANQEQREELAKQVVEKLSEYDEETAHEALLRMTDSLNPGEIDNEAHMLMFLGWEANAILDEKKPPIELDEGDEVIAEHAIAKLKGLRTVNINVFSDVSEALDTIISTEISPDIEDNEAVFPEIEDSMTFGEAKEIISKNAPLLAIRPNTTTADIDYRLLGTIRDRMEDEIGQDIEQSRN